MTKNQAPSKSSSDQIGYYYYCVKNLRSIENQGGPEGGTPRWGLAWLARAVSQATGLGWPTAATLWRKMKGMD
jgi:hypothetical protein